MIVALKSPAAIVGVVLMAAGSPSGAREPARLCDIVNKTDPWMPQRAVEMTAILIEGPEGSFLFDPSCPDEDHLVWVQEMPASLPGTDAEREIRSRKRYSANGLMSRVQVTLTGAYSPYVGQGYGPQGEFLQQVRVSEVRTPTEVSGALPWPNEEPGRQAHRARNIHTVSELDHRWRDFLAGAADTPLDASAMSPRYMVIDDKTAHEGSARVAELARTLPKPRIGRYASNVVVHVWDVVAVTSGEIFRQSCRLSYTNTYERTASEWRLVATRLSPCVPVP